MKKSYIVRTSLAAVLFLCIVPMYGADIERDRIAYEFEGDWATIMEWQVNLPDMQTTYPIYKKILKKYDPTRFHIQKDFYEDLYRQLKTGYATYVESKFYGDMTQLWQEDDKHKSKKLYEKFKREYTAPSDFLKDRELYNKIYRTLHFYHDMLKLRFMEDDDEANKFFEKLMKKYDPAKDPDIKEELYLRRDQILQLKQWRDNERKNLH